jgi:hypothetical protein
MSLRQSVLYHLDSDFDSPTPYVRGGGLLKMTGSKQTTEFQSGLSAGGGVKIPTGHRLAIRIDGDVSRWFVPGHDSLLPARWELSLRFGLSFFTKRVIPGTETQ